MLRWLSGMDVSASTWQNIWCFLGDGSLNLEWTPLELFGFLPRILSPWLLRLLILVMLGLGAPLNSCFEGEDEEEEEEEESLKLVLGLAGYEVLANSFC